MHRAFQLIMASRWWWTPVAIGGAIAAAVLTAGRAHADNIADEIYLATVHQAGISSALGDAGLVVAGHEICAAFVRGDSFASVVGQLDATNPGLGVGDAGSLIGAAVGTYCTQYEWVTHGPQRQRMQEAF